ncbi:NmrA-like family protein [Xylariaceae sp. FL0016]|nr:NmrA-like family protein [Xylariaceae sp. FL0016]
MPDTAIQNVAVVGANGNLGSVVLRTLLEAGSFTVTVVKRASSTSSSPSTAKTATVDDGLSTASLTAALQGQDAVVVCFPLKDVSQHLRICDAAVAAGVRRLIPADYGSCDSSSPRAQELVPLFKNKTAVRERLQDLSRAHAGFSWTSIVCGHFFDWGLREDFLHFDLRARRADFLDGGRYRSSTATLGRVAEAVVRVLRRLERTRDRVLFIQSFCVSQLDVLASLEKATGTPWQVKDWDSEEFIRCYKAKADTGDKAAIEDLVFALGALDGNWETREGFAMELLGLENEDLDEVVKRVVDEELGPSGH